MKTACLLVLVRGDCHELCLRENVCAESVTDLLLDGECLIRLGFHYVYSWLILVHGVQYKLEKKRKKKARLSNATISTKSRYQTKNIHTSWYVPSQLQSTLSHEKHF
jgi:hypothetical protein